jgi:threonine synthase
VDGRRVSRELEDSRATRRADSLSARCAECDRFVDLTPAAWRCDCGGPLEIEPPARLSETALDGDGLWRYLPWLPVEQVVSLGEPSTALVTHEAALLKLEGALPSGSFKDRGAAVLASWMAEQGVRHVVEDSSGNAGTALAAYCARAGIAVDLYVPKSASPEKVVQAQVYGARLHAVPGARGAATDAAVAAVEDGATYASHLWHPLFQAGTETFAFELWEQLGRRAPDAVAVAVGAGSLLLGAARGFERLERAALVDEVPRIFGVQAAEAPPVGRPDPAEGIRVVNPPRMRAVVSAAERTGGAMQAVTEDAIWDAHAALGAIGIYAEPTGAVGFAGYRALLAEGRIDPGETTVVAVTGTGLKTATTIRARLAEPGEGLS